MKFTDDMLFIHPVLSPDSTDFIDGRFEAAFEVSIDEQEIVVTATLSVICTELQALIEEGDAGCGFYLICRETYENRLIEMSLGTASHRFRANGFFGTVQLRPVIWSKVARDEWRCKQLNPEYGGVTSFPDAAILALAAEHRFSVDRHRLRPFETIFSLAASDNLERGQIDVDPDNDKIRIFVHSETKDSIDHIRNDPQGRTVLLNAIYLPVVMRVLIDLRQGDFAGRSWFRIFVAKCSASGIDPKTVDPLEGAQRLLKFPFARVEDQKERLFS